LCLKTVLQDIWFEMDLRTALITAIKTGKVLIGKKRTEKALLIGNPKLVLVSEECEEKEKIKYFCKLANVDCKILKMPTLSLGALCGKPFPISALAIINPGESNILEVKNWEQYV